jgi:DNA polymerase-3 subunit delta
VEITYQSGAPEILWKSGVQRVYLFSGEEDRLKEEAVLALSRHLVSPDFEDFDRESFDVGNATADVILASAGQVPFGSDYRLIVVKGLEQWRERGKEAEAERMAIGIARLPNTACLVMVAAAGEEEAKRKTAVTVKLDNAVKKAGAIVLCPALKGEALVRWVAGRVRAEGKKIEPDAIEMLIDSAGGEMLFLEQEILKLVCYAGERDIVGVSDVRMVTAASPEDVLFQVIDAITKRQTDRALLLLSELHRYDPKPQAVAGKLLTLLARQYRMLWQAKYLAENRVQPREVRALPPELAAELPSEGNIAQVAFKAGDLFTQARSMTWADMTRAQELLLLCDLANKGGVTEETVHFSSDPAGNLRLLILELTGATRPDALPSR